MSHLQKIDNELRKCNERLSILLSEDAITAKLAPFSPEFLNYCEKIVEIARNKNPTYQKSISASGDSIVVMEFGNHTTRHKMTLTKYNDHISETYYLSAFGNSSQTTYTYDNEIDVAGNVDGSISSACGLSLEDKAESAACLQRLISK
jgi:hypothetical protein